MTTNNIISTPNITGNIGSCSVQSNDIISANSFWTSEHTVLQINSCTGEIVTQAKYTDYSGLQILALIVGIAIIAITIAGLSAWAQND